MNLAMLAALALQPAPMVEQVQVQHKFVFVADRKYSRVNVAGTFNGWNRDATALQVDADGRTWRVELPLPVGKHFYKFVLDGDTWITDPNSLRDENDGNGNINSVLILWPEDYSEPAAVGDGLFTESPLYHAQTVPSLNYDRGRLTLTLRVRPDDVERIEVVGADGTATRMQRQGADEIYATYSASVAYQLGREYEYTFRLTDGAQTRYFGPEGLGSNPEGNRFRLSPRTWQPFSPPTWVEGTVFYQIFPDRFENGDPSNDPADAFGWDDAPTYYSFHGGDFEGVRQRIPYLKELGVSAIYFNPIFQSPSNHRYETTDYLQVDHRLGTNEGFAELTEELEASGIRVVLDGVFNHTATDFEPFEDIVRNGKGSSYLDWFFVRSFPIQRDPPSYEAWFGFPSMPKVNLENPDAKNFMLGVVDFWDANARIAGWRLDVANEVPMSFWRVFRERVKSHGEDRWIVGEVWGDGSPWLKGDQWDSVMNYQFRGAALRFVNEGGTPTGFMEDLMRVYASYGPQVSRNMMNLLSSHDTPRFFTLVGEREDLAKLGATLQFTWVGAPSIYYGEELGMAGDRDPDNRRGMRWDLATAENEILAHYEKLIALRNTSPALQSGDPVRVQEDDAAGTVVFARVLEDDFALVAVNRAEEARTLQFRIPDEVPLGEATRLWDALGIRFVALDDRSIRLTLPPVSAAVLVPDAWGSRPDSLHISAIP